MDYKRLFLNWLKRNDPQNLFECRLQNNNQTLKNHIKDAQNYDQLIMCSSFVWSHTTEGPEYWVQFYKNWRSFYINWAEKHRNNLNID